jgi:hypothetical protein
MTDVDDEAADHCWRRLGEVLDDLMLVHRLLRPGRIRGLVAPEIDLRDIDSDLAADVPDTRHACDT